MAGDRQVFADKVRRLHDVPDVYKLVALVPAGYPDQIPDPGKRQFDEVVFENRCRFAEPVEKAAPARRGVSLKARLRHLVRGWLLKWF